MRYYLDTEFIEDGLTIDLISLGIVCEDGRELYIQNEAAKFDKAGDWVARNVLPQLTHFDMGKRTRDCLKIEWYLPQEEYIGACGRNKRGGPAYYHPECSWRTRQSMRNSLALFIKPGNNFVPQGDKPEFWGYYADYDWVALCQLWGRMVDLPGYFPKYCMDLKHLSMSMGDLRLPPQDEGEHHALADARWNKRAHEYLMQIQQNRDGEGGYPRSNDQTPLAFQPGEQDPDPLDIEKDKAL